MCAAAKLGSDLYEYLGSVPLLEGINQDVLRALARSARVRRLSKGELLFSQMDPADAVYIVRRGGIAIFLATPDGRELVINEMLPGDCFGELSLLTDQSRSTGAEAREPSEVIWISHQDFMRALQGEPELMRRVLETTADRLRNSSERESALAFLDSSARLARVLLQLEAQEGGEGTAHVTHEELALFVGLARQTVSEKLGRWRHQGWVRTGRGKIEILRRDRLERQARKALNES
jgi:CRP/FNR family cyclic AMP-dependent transcriptional regulator